jgi:hypothetical protein
MGCRWALWFQFFILIFLFLVYFSRQGNSYRVSLMVMLAMVCPLCRVLYSLWATVPRSCLTAQWNRYMKGSFGLRCHRLA